MAISFKARPATSLFDDVGRRVDWQGVNPPQTDASGFAGVVETL
jgi:hypothetical protein